MTQNNVSGLIYELRRIDTTIDYHRAEIAKEEARRVELTSHIKAALKRSPKPALVTGDTVAMLDGNGDVELIPAAWAHELSIPSDEPRDSGSDPIVAESFEPAHAASYETAGGLHRDGDF